MPVCTEDLDKAMAEVTGTFHNVEEISAELRESIVNYIKGETYWRFCRPARWKITAVPVTTRHMGSVDNTRHLLRAKMLLVPMNFFSSG